MDDRASEENLPRRSGCKATKTIHEEQANKYIQLGSQTTIPKMLGSSKPPKVSEKQAPKGGTSILPHK
jgi:hypothetical protein